MSYNISMIKVLSGDILMSQEKYLAWESKTEDLPESNPFDENRPVNEEGKVSLINGESFYWSGEFSGTSYNNGTFKKVIGDTEGYAELLFIWEYGDTIEGVKVKDGRFWECPVTFFLNED